MCIARTRSVCEIFVIANENASAGHWRAQVAVTHPPRAVQVQLLPDALENRPVLLTVQDAGPSRRQRGFKSRTGHCGKAAEKVDRSKWKVEKTLDAFVYFLLSQNDSLEVRIRTEFAAKWCNW